MNVATSAHANVMLSEREIDAEIEAIMGLVKQSAETMDDAGARLRRLRDSEAWKVKGYKSWTAFVQGEFPFTRKTAHALITQAEVIQFLSDAVGAPVDVNVKQARQFKRGSAIQKQGVVRKIMSGADARAAIREEIPITRERVRDDYVDDSFDDGEPIYRCRHCQRTGTLATLGYLSLERDGEDAHTAGEPDW